LLLVPHSGCGTHPEGSHPPGHELGGGSQSGCRAPS
jgi:hypothetical protein